MKPTPLITPSEGGRWMSQSSADTAGPLNYAEKVNFRRDGDVEARREGWRKFRPNETLPQGAQHLALGGGAKLSLLAENVRPNSERCVIAATKTTIYRYTYSTGLWTTIGTGFSTNGRRWQAVTINGYIILNNAVDLPVSYRVEHGSVTPVRELRENGIASVKWITHYNGFLFCLNVTRIIPAQLNGVMNGLTPYGLVASNLTETIPYRVIWSDFSDPTNWAPLFNVTMAAASATITLPFASSAFVAGQTRVAVLNGGADGTTLGGDEDYPEGILVTNVVGNVLTLEITTHAGLSYPRTVQVTRWSDISTMSKYKDLQGDASHIICAKPLHSTLVVYRTKGIFVGRYKADVEEPFDWRERVPETENVPIWGEAVATVGDDEMHLYPGSGDFFFSFDGVNPPERHAVMDETRRRFFSGITEASDVWAVKNPLTHEIWFCRPTFTVCYDYFRKTASEMDAEVDAAAFVSKPGWEDDWFILSIGGSVFTYGRENGAATTFLRDGVNPGGRLVWGRNSFGDTYGEKGVGGYLMQFASIQQAMPIRFKLFGAHSASSTREELLNEIIADPMLDGGHLPLHYLATYFQDELHIAGDGDLDVRFIGRVLERASVNSKSVTRKNA